MKGFLGFGSKVKNKLGATRFEFSFTVHSLQPWPAGNKAIAIGWQRGKRRRGATRSVYPSTAPGKLGCVVRFNEKFELPASLYKTNATGSSKDNNNTLGPFKKKCIILAVLETDGRTQATAALGRVVIDLAEFAAVESQETRIFQVACNKSIHASVGDPQLTVTIRCCWKKSSTVGAGGAQMDEAGSMSTDTTGSRLTANLSSFLRYKHSSNKLNEEQDLQGFEKRGGDGDKGSYMGTIEESADEPAGSPPRSNLTSNFTTPRPTTSMPASPNRSVAGMQTKSLINEEAGDHGFLRDSDLGSKSRMTSAAGGISRGVSAAGAGAAMATPTRTLGGASAAGAPPSGLEADIILGLKAELLQVAATEVCLYLGQAAAASSSRAQDRALHATARQLARTVACLGPHAGVGFGTHALQLVESLISAHSGEAASLMFWWSNMVHLRGLLHTCKPNAMWAWDALAAKVGKVERTAFEQLVQTLWSGTLLPLVSGGAKGGAKAAPQQATGSTGGVSPSPSPSKQPAASNVSKRAQQEVAIKHWCEGLDEVHRQLSKLAIGAHGAVLKQQVLAQILKRVDALLFCHLLTGSEPGDLLLDYDPNSSIWGGAGGPMPQLDEASLPFSRGVLTFGGGMSVKMLVTRLKQWASTEAPEATRPSLGPAPALFPLLHATADLLMMPKDLLMDRAIRLDVCQALSLRSMVHILENFQPDEFAQDGINPDVVEVLKEELLRSLNIRPPLSDLSTSYRPPQDDVIQQQVDSRQEPGLEYDSAAESELWEISRMARGGPAEGAVRFQLLHDLWSSCAPR